MLVSHIWLWPENTWFVLYWLIEQLSLNWIETLRIINNFSWIRFKVFLLWTIKVLRLTLILMHVNPKFIILLGSKYMFSFVYKIFVFHYYKLINYCSTDKILDLNKFYHFKSNNLKELALPIPWENTLTSFFLPYPQTFLNFGHHENSFLKSHIRS